MAIIHFDRDGTAGLGGKVLLQQGMASQGRGSGEDVIQTPFQYFYLTVCMV